jgi:hypothetical protein
MGTLIPYEVCLLFSFSVFNMDENVIAEPRAKGFIPPWLIHLHHETWSVDNRSLFCCATLCDSNVSHDFILLSACLSSKIKATNERM